MIRRPPRSTLFPYNDALPISAEKTARRLASTCSGSDSNSQLQATTARRVWCRGTAVLLPPRSEEHTSELQSQSNLVCRLLLEKKKKARSITWAPTHSATQTRD